MVPTNSCWPQVSKHCAENCHLHTKEVHRQELEHRNQEAKKEPEFCAESAHKRAQASHKSEPFVRTRATRA